MTQKDNTILILAKDVLFIALGCFLILRRQLLGTLLGALIIIWYGRDFWYRGTGWLNVRDRRDKVERPSANRTASRKDTSGTPAAEEGKIQVTDLSDAKEVHFEKE